MHRLCLIVFLACLGVPSLLRGAWPGVPFAEVRAYAWPANQPPTKLVSDDGRLAPRVLNPDGALLSPSQVRRLLAAQQRRVKRVDGRIIFAGCYYPHNAFLFRDARGRVVAFLEICFDCHGARSQPADENSDPDFPALAVIFSELKLPFGNMSLSELRKKDRGYRGKK